MTLPDVEAYTICSHDVGAVVRATSAGQMDVALKDLQARLKVVEGRPLLPLGHLTNLKSVKRPSGSTPRPHRSDITLTASV